MLSEAIKRQYISRLGTEQDADVQQWIRRIDLQLEFSEALTTALPEDQTQGWRQALKNAERIVEAISSQVSMQALIAAVLAAESEMAEIGNAAKKFTVHCVGHGHIDMNWLWSWSETVSTTYDTFSSVLSLMERYPDLTYSQSQGAIYALVEQYFPRMFERIRQRVAEGRWEITASHWVEGDKNLVSGESLGRHLLYTRRYFRERFGLEPEDQLIDWEPDTFGHAQTVPAIDALGSVKYYYCCRTGGGFDHSRVGNERPPLFYWQSPNGVRVLVCQEQTWYNSYTNIGDNIALPLVNGVAKTKLHDWMNVYGIGNHGGGPTRKEIEYYAELQTWPIYPNVVFSTVKKYFAAVEHDITAFRIDLPVIAHELNYEFTGCYTSQSSIKRANRYGENYLEEAETLALIASRLYGRDYPADELSKAWHHVLFNQFHDILPGSGIRETREYALGLFQEVGAITGAIKRLAAEALIKSIDTVSLLPHNGEGEEERRLFDQNCSDLASEAGAGCGSSTSGLSVSASGGKFFKPHVVYNPGTWVRSERVVVSLFDTNFPPDEIVAIDDKGVVHPTLWLGDHNFHSHQQIIVAFDALDVPALGYKTFLLCRQDAPPPIQQVRCFPNDRAETPFLKMRFDRFGSGVSELVDKRSGVSYLREGARALGVWEYVVETPREMTAWILGETKTLCPLLPEEWETVGVSKSVATQSPSPVPNNGFVVNSLLNVPGTRSTIRTSMSIGSLEPRIDIEAQIDWREIGDRKTGIPGLILRLPLALTDLTWRFEVPFGSITRELCGGQDVPSLRYAYAEGMASNGKKVGFTLLQDCKYGHFIEGSDLCLRIIRSSFDPDKYPEIGETTVRYSLYFHDQPQQPSDLARLGAAWNHPLLVFPASFQRGDGPAVAGLINVKTPNVCVTALKQAESGEGIILRLVELDGQDTTAEIEMSPQLTAGLNVAQRVDLLERPLDLPVSWTGSTLTIVIKPYDIVTVWIT